MVESTMTEDKRPQFTVSRVEEADVVEYLKIHYRSFTPCLGVLWHKEPSEASYKTMAEDRKKALTSPESTILKAVDTQTGRIAGVAWWKVYSQTRTKEEIEESFIEQQWPPEINMEARKAFLKGLHDARRTYLGTQPCVLLAHLIVDPIYQRQGIGRLLLQFGLDKADELGLVGYLEASYLGKGLYEKVGFEPAGEIYCDLKPWGGDRVDVHTIMFRQPVKK